MVTEQASLLPDIVQKDQFIAGIDEVGRGCLAGPVIAAAVVLPSVYDLPGLTDSKKLSPKARSLLAPRIKDCALAWGLGIVWQKRIDQINILNATLEAMAMACSQLKISVRMLLIDGNKIIPASMLANYWHRVNASQLPHQKYIIKGDQKIPAISAASILAKNFRDKLMKKLARKWPQYGFERHMGYGTRAHLSALQVHGPCPLHRLTFRRVCPQVKDACSPAETLLLGN